jgi:hypothetical protein
MTTDEGLLLYHIQLQDIKEHLKNSSEFEFKVCRNESTLIVYKHNELHSDVDTFLISSLFCDHILSEEVQYSRQPQIFREVETYKLQPCLSRSLQIANNEIICLDKWDYNSYGTLNSKQKIIFIDYNKHLIRNFHSRIKQYFQDILVSQGCQFT